MAADEALRLQLRREADILAAQLIHPRWWRRGFLKRRFLTRCMVAGWNLMSVELELDGAIHDPHILTVLVMVADAEGPVTAEQLRQRFGPRSL